MGAGTGIEWTDATWNPIGGCSIHSPGCIHCYAQKLAGTRLKRHPLYAGTTKLVKGKPVFNGVLTAADDDAAVWRWPLSWRGAKQPVMGAGKPSLIFVGDMSDLFHEDRPDEVIDRVFAIMALCPQHIFQVLTKRADRLRRYLLDPHTCNRIYGLVCDLTLDGFAKVVLMAPTSDEELAPPGRRIYLDKWPLPNVWIGVSVENQSYADERIPLLLDTPAAVRFLSCEPLLGPIDFSESSWAAQPKLDWIIAGGESGHDARPMNPQWARWLRNQCADAGVSFFFKQWGEWRHKGPKPSETPGRFALAPREFDGPIVEVDHYPRQFASFGSTVLERIGKKEAGRNLDGVEHINFPRQP